MSDLVDKLRVLIQHLEEHDGGHARIHAEAADRITFLEALVERLKEQERKLYEILEALVQRILTKP